MKPKAVSAAEFKAKCLALFDQVELRGRSFVITKRGRPVARVVPLDAGKPGSLRGSVVSDDDLLSPIAVEWDALR